MIHTTNDTTNETTELIPIAEIHEDSAFAFRRDGVNKGHARTLTQTLRAKCKLMPILVWRSEPDGKLILLDGLHRLAAYRTVRGKVGMIDAIVITGTRQTAMLRAIDANTRDTLPLTPSERADAAWRLVREFPDGLSKAQIARTSGIAPRTVATMRTRWKTMHEQEQEATGQWWRDRKDQADMEGDGELMTDKERAEQIKAMAKLFQKAAGMWPKRELELVADALFEAFGHRHKDMAEHLYAVWTDEDHYATEIDVINETDELEDMPF